MKDWICILLLAFGLPLLAATPPRAGSYVEAVKLAKEMAVPVAVYVHGASWHGASQKFGEQIWASGEFASALSGQVILTDIHIRQNLEKEEAARYAERYQGWDAKSVSSYPAIQLIAADGHLLKAYGGRDLRAIVSADHLAQQLNRAIAAAGVRRELLKKIASARESADAQAELSHLVELIELPLNQEAQIVEQLKKVDPNDSSGWQARLGFKNWEFVRHASGLIEAKKFDEALAETEKLLASKKHRPEQRALILGARGKALVAKGDLNLAWKAFQEAYETSPDGPNGKAMLSYGKRVAGIPLREAFPQGSILDGRELGENLTRDQASFTMSSAASDNPADHPTLFAGNYAPSGFAFHTDAEREAHIVVDLKAECLIRAIRIQNRTTLYDRAKTLTVWASSDQQDWGRLWSAEKGEAAWDILLDDPVKARFLKIGLDSEEPQPLHLRSVDVFGASLTPAL